MALMEGRPDRTQERKDAISAALMGWLVFGKWQAVCGLVGGAVARQRVAGGCKATPYASEEEEAMDRSRDGRQWGGGN